MSSKLVPLAARLANHVRLRYRFGIASITTSASVRVSTTTRSRPSSFSAQYQYQRNQTSIPPKSFDLQRTMSTTTTVSSAVKGVPFGKSQIPEISSNLDQSTGICTLTINRPDKANAFKLSMYKQLGYLLNEASSDPTVKIVVLTGNGKFFSAGNDLTIWEGEQDGQTNVIGNMVGALIDLRKPILALVNGPAIGIGATLLAHCDGVYATKSAYFLTPFTTLGICAEACSSYLFPKMMGNIRAANMLMFNAKIEAEEAVNLGLVTRVFPDTAFAQETAKIVEATAKLPILSLLTSKELIRGPEREKLHAISKIEFERVGELVAGDEAKQAVLTFLEAKAKSKKK